MQWVRPKSLSGLMLFGLGLLALPLLVAIITAALAIRFGLQLIPFIRLGS